MSEQSLLNDIITSFRTVDARNNTPLIDTVENAIRSTLVLTQVQPGTMMPSEKTSIIESIAQKRSMEIKIIPKSDVSFIIDATRVYNRDISKIEQFDVNTLYEKTPHGVHVALGRLFGSGCPFPGRKKKKAPYVFFEAMLIDRTSKKIMTVIIASFRCNKTSLQLARTNKYREWVLPACEKLAGCVIPDSGIEIMGFKLKFVGYCGRLDTNGLYRECEVKFN